MKDKKHWIKTFRKYHPENTTKEGYLKVEVIDDALNNGKNSIVRIRCMDNPNRECELLVFTSDLKFDDKVTGITNKF